MRQHECGAQPQHAGLITPGFQPCPLLRLIERKLAQDREPAGMIPHGFDRDGVGVRIPAWRMDDRGIHARLIHLGQQVLGGEARHLAMLAARCAG